VDRITDDPIDLLQRLSAEQIVARIDRLDGEISSLRVLLRAARARERRSIPPGASEPPRAGEGGTHGR
jgi:hypothetical protein